MKVKKAKNIFEIEIKNIYGKQINIHGKPLRVNQQRKFKRKTQEIKNLIRQKYVEPVKTGCNSKMKKISSNEHDEVCLDYNVDKELPECICKKKNEKK